MIGTTEKVYIKLNSTILLMQKSVEEKALTVITDMMVKSVKGTAGAFGWRIICSPIFTVLVLDFSSFINNRHYRNLTGSKYYSCSVRSKQFTLSASSYVLNSHVLISLATWHAFYKFSSYSWNLPGKRIRRKKKKHCLYQGNRWWPIISWLKHVGFFSFILGVTKVDFKMGYRSIFFSLV